MVVMVVTAEAAADGGSNKQMIAGEFTGRAREPFAPGLYPFRQEDCAPASLTRVLVSSEIFRA